MINANHKSMQVLSIVVAGHNAKCTAPLHNKWTPTITRDQLLGFVYVTQILETLPLRPYPLDPPWRGPQT